MNADTTEQLARELARRSEPVRRVPRLRAPLALALALAALAAATFLSWKGVSLPAPSPALWVFGALVGGASLLGSGALVAALAMAVPGRGATVRAGLGAAGVGLVLLAGVVPLLLYALPTASSAGPPRADLVCLLSAAGLGLPPAAAALWFLARAVPQRPQLAVLVAAVGAVGLGALAARASCPLGGWRHVLLGHASAPLVGALLVALPLWLLLRRYGRATRVRPPS